jgi:hypothetical protein
MAPAFHELFALHETESARVDPCLGGNGGAGAPLTTRAVAVSGGLRGLAELEPNSAADAASAERVDPPYGESRTGSVFGWLMNGDSTIVGGPAGSIAGNRESVSSRRI